MTVLVTGASGQLGQALHALASKYNTISFYFANSQEADITDNVSLETIFKKIKPQYCINTAAYTAVDKAEAEPEKAIAVNTTGARNIAEACKKYGTTLVHISTDFVFDGTKKTPYTEEDPTNPQSIYGLTKRDGELEIQKTISEYYIIRTSWVYSQFGHNFMKTMLRLAQERDSLNVVNDQVGSPTNANNLAEALVQIILSGKTQYGIYHYSNHGVASWYDFAREIFRINNIAITVNPIDTQAYPTPAKRPAYSVLDKSKITEAFGLHIKNWPEAITPQ